MKIVYVAKHAPRDNCDENAIAYALTKLGHEVVCVEERVGSNAVNLKGDLLLFHKWEDDASLRKVNMPSVMWFFDLVDGTHDPMLKARSEHRIAWAERMQAQCALTFFTDGDWAARMPERRRHLPQGADERVAGFGLPLEGDHGLPPILFTGMTAHGSKRVEHVEHLGRRWGNLFSAFGGGARTRKHGRELASIFATSKVIIAPDGPGTDLYWSNRVYLTTSLGGFLLHPWSKGLAKQYRPDQDLIFYRDREELDYLIERFLQDDEWRQRMRMAGHQRTMAHHTYRHRCEDLIRMVKEAGIL